MLQIVWRKFLPQVLAAFLGLSGFLYADIEVKVTGVSKADVVAIELRFKLKGVSEFASEASKALKGQKKKTQKALAELELKDLSTHYESFTMSSRLPGQDRFGNRVFVNGQMNGGVMKKKLQIEEVLVLSLPVGGAKDHSQFMLRITDVIDTAMESGVDPMGVPNPQMAYYYQANPSLKKPGVFYTPIVKNAKQLRLTAIENAISSARIEADSIAKMSGLQVQKIKLVRVLNEIGLESTQNPRQASCSVSLQVIFETQ